MERRCRTRATRIRFSHEASTSVAKHQSAWGFTATQWTVPVLKDCTACNVSVCCFTVKMGVTHAFRWIASKGYSHTTHATILTNSMSLLQRVKTGTASPDWSVSMFNIHAQDCCGCSDLDMPELREITETTDWRAKQPLQMSYLSEDMKC